jgi:hypothetical protein
MSSSTIADLIDEARREHWCTKRHCTTCGAGPWRAGVQRIAHTSAHLAQQLELLPLSAWYDLPEFGGAIYHSFSLLSGHDQVDRVLDNWLTRLAGHYRIADAVCFYVIRERQSSERLRHDWLARSEAMAIESRDPSLLETLVYSFEADVHEHTELLRVAESARRGYAPLDRALRRTAEIRAPGT